MSNKIRLEEPNLVSFVHRIAELAAEGYTIDDTNQGAPQSWGPGLYTCDMTLESSKSDSKAPEAKTSTEPKETEEKSTEEASEGSEEKSEDKPKTTNRRTRRKSTATKK